MDEKIIMNLINETYQIPLKLFKIIRTIDTVNAITHKI